MITTEKKLQLLTNLISSNFIDKSLIRIFKSIKNDVIEYNKPLKLAKPDKLWNGNKET